MKSTFEKAVYATPVDHQDIEKEWRARGFSFGVFRDAHGQEWNDFVHDTHEYVIVSKGTLIVSVGDETAVCEAGDLVWIPKGTRHSLKTTSANGSVWIYGYGNND